MAKESSLTRSIIRLDVFIFCICLVILGFYVISSYDYSIKPVQMVIKRFEERNSPKSSVKHVLLYSNTSWTIPSETMDSQYFESVRCPVTSCIVTTNYSYLPSLVQYDALVFWAHGKWRHFEYPRERGPDQIYVMAMLESPQNVKKTFKMDSQLINWTMSYRLDSDVVWAYGYFRGKSSKRLIAPNVDPEWKTITEDHFSRSFFKTPKILNLINEKTKQVAWFVSNCKTPSKRMEVVESLRKFIPVDIYGKCGDKSCPRENEPNCRQMVEQVYKFYLGFENSLCADYVTEKVFSNMHYFIIPVIYGGANYTRFLPPRSYINVLDFNSTEALADHLWYLSLHPEEYIKYFWWKEYYYISSLSYCDLCVKLHQDKRQYQRQHYSDIDSWYRDGACQTWIPIKLSGVAKSWWF